MIGHQVLESRTVDNQGGEGGTRTVMVPTKFSTPQHVLQGHRSIVNTSLFHPTLPLVFTCGIEKVVRVHSCTLSSGATTGVNFKERQAGHAEYFQRRLGTWDDQVETQTTQEDLDTLAYFDELLEEEKGIWSASGYSDIEENEDEEDDEWDELRDLYDRQRQSDSAQVSFQSVAEDVAEEEDGEETRARVQVAPIGGSTLSSSTDEEAEI